VDMRENPFAEAFTTVRVRNGVYLFLDRHIERLRCHALQLGIRTEQIELGSINLPSSNDALVRISVSKDGVVKTKERQAPSLHQHVDAMSCHFPAAIQIDSFEDATVNGDANPQRSAEMVNGNKASVPQRLIGLKHGAWEFYRQTTIKCKQQNCDVAFLLNRDDVVVDGDRATPLLFTAAGELVTSELRYGGVDSVTLGVLETRLENSGMRITRQRISRKSLHDALEVMMVGSGVGVAKIRTLDGKKLNVEDHVHSLMCTLYDNDSE